MATACPPSTRDPAGAPFANALVLLVCVGNGTFWPDWKMVVGPFGPRVDESVSAEAPLGSELVEEETVLKVREGVVAVKREPTPPLRPPVEVTTADESAVLSEVEEVEVSEEVVDVSEEVVESVVTTVPAVAQ